MPWNLALQIPKHQHKKMLIWGGSPLFCFVLSLRRTSPTFLKSSLRVCFSLAVLCVASWCVCLFAIRASALLGWTDPQGSDRKGPRPGVCLSWPCSRPPTSRHARTSAMATALSCLCLVRQRGHWSHQHHIFLFCWVCCVVVCMHGLTSLFSDLRSKKNRVFR